MSKIYNGIRQVNEFTVSPTSRIWSRNNIGQCRQAFRVEKWIKETKWFFIFRQKEIIQQGENRRDSLFCFRIIVLRVSSGGEETYRATGAGSTYWKCFTTDNNLEIPALRGDIWISAPTRADEKIMR